LPETTSASGGEHELDSMTESELASLLDDELADLGFSASTKLNG
jgi:hypothetical protein